jgi:hypothetical protein
MMKGISEELGRTGKVEGRKGGRKANAGMGPKRVGGVAGGGKARNNKKAHKIRKRAARRPAGREARKAGGRNSQKGKGRKAKSQARTPKRQADRSGHMTRTAGPTKKYYTFMKI